MNPVQATTGHSRPQERNVAKSLYIALIIAVVLGMIIFFFVGQKKSLNPMNSTPTSAPATPSDAGSGAGS